MSIRKKFEKKFSIKEIKKNENAMHETQRKSGNGNKKNEMIIMRVYKKKKNVLDLKPTIIPFRKFIY